MKDKPSKTGQQMGSLMAYVVVVLASSFYFYEFFLRVMPTVITGELMQAFSIGTGQLGQLLGCFFYAYALMQLPAGLLCDRFGAKKCLVFAVFVCAMSILMFQATGLFSVASLSRLAIGAASAFAFIGPLALSNRWFPADKQALITGCVQIMGCVGAVIAGSPIRYLVETVGWRDATFYAGIIGIVLTALFAVILKNQPDDDSQDDGLEKNQNEPDIIHTLKIVATNKVNWQIGFAAFGSWAAVAIFAESWGVPFLNILQNQTDEASASQLMWVWIAMAIASPLAGWYSDFIKERVRPTMLLLSVGLISSVILIALQPSNSYFVSFLLFMIGASSGAQPITFGLINDVNRKETMATAIALNNMILVCSTGVLTPISGYILEYYSPASNLMPTSIAAYQSAFMIVPISIALCMAVFYSTVKETHCKPIENEDLTLDSMTESVIDGENPSAI